MEQKIYELFKNLKWWFKEKYWLRKVCLNLVFLLLAFNQSICNNHIDDDSIRYMIAYDYLTNDSFTIKQIYETFESALSRKEKKKFKEKKQLEYCIDSIASPIIISDFSRFWNSEIASRIRLIDFRKVPSNLMVYSNCTSIDKRFNMTFSIFNENYLTIEISLRMFNPLGGGSQGPTIKFLFEFTEDNAISQKYYQRFMNG